MAITVHGVEADLDHPYWEQVQEAQSLLNGLPAGIISGFNVSVATGTRLVTVSAGRAAVPGCEIISDAPVTPTPLDAGTAGQGRLDLVVLEVDQRPSTPAKNKTTAGTIKILKGQPAADDSAVARIPTQTPGVLYQIPLTTVPVAASTGQLAQSQLDDVRPLADTGWVATTPAGNWSRPAANGLAVRRKGAGPVSCDGRLLLAADAATRAVGTEYPLSGLRLIPGRFTPAREVFTDAYWDIGNGTTPGHAIVRIDEAGFGFVSPVNKALVAGKTIRIHTTWEV